MTTCPLAAVGIDRAAVVERLGGDASLLVDVSEIFVADCPRMVQTLQAAAAARDAVGLARATHAIAGAVGNFTEEGAYTMARTVEHFAREENVDAALETVPALLAELERMRQALAQLK
jgi:two-component system, sensor histidine kinase and response regulator